MNAKVVFSVSAAIGFFLAHLGATQGQDLVPRFDQRYIGADYDVATGTLPDASGNGQTAIAQTDTVGVNATPGGSFSFVTTPSGATALQNLDAFLVDGGVNVGDTGERLQFTRVDQLGGTNGFTIQAVFAGVSSSDTPDGSTGVFSLGENDGFSGVFLGGQPGSVEIRGGNVDNQGNIPGAFLNDGAVPNAAFNGVFAIYTLVVDPTASAGNVLTATIVDPASEAVLASTALGDPGTAIEGIGNVGGLFTGSVDGNAFGDQDNFQGAIAEVVVYNYALSPGELDRNNAYFYGAYFEEPSVLLGDVNLDGAVDFLDISPFIAVLATGGFQVEADIDM